MNKNKLQSPIALGVDIGGSHIICAAVDLTNGEIIESSRQSMEVDGSGSKEEILWRWLEVMRKGVENINPTGFAGVGIAMPGPFDYETGICRMQGVGKYESLYGVDVRKVISEGIKACEGLPIVFKNDATCFVMGEQWKGSAHGESHVLGITLGTGMGSTFLTQGQMTQGKGMIPDDGFLYHIPWGDGVADDCFSTRGLLRRAKDCTGGCYSGVKELAQLSESDILIQQLFVDFGTDLGRFLTPYLKDHGTGVLVLGGNISRAMELFAPSLTDQVHRGGIDVKVVSSELWEDASIVGSARLVSSY